MVPALPLPRIPDHNDTHDRHLKGGCDASKESHTRLSVTTLGDSKKIIIPKSSSFPLILARFGTIYFLEIPFPQIGVVFHSLNLLNPIS